MMKPSFVLVRRTGAPVLRGIALLGAGDPQQSAPPPFRPCRRPPRIAHVINRYCVSCHNDRLKSGWARARRRSPRTTSARHPDVWEKVVRKLRARQMPPVGMPRPDEAHLRRGDRVPGDVARPRGRGESESRPHGDVPAAHSNRIPERHPRSARARRRCRLAAARRRVQLWLRQRDGRRSFADAAGPLHLGGGEDQPAGGRASQPFSGRRHDQDSSRTSPRRSTSRAFRSARAAARWSPTRFRWTASTRSRFG